MASNSSVRFPNETAAYRDAREALLTAEMELRRRIEHVAELRRTMPAGGAVPEDYEFDEIVVDPSGSERVQPVRLSGLFAAGQPSWSGRAAPTWLSSLRPKQFRSSFLSGAIS